MATTARLLDHVTLAEGDRIQAAEAPDLVDGSTLEIIVIVHEATEGEAPVLSIQHAAEADDEAWMDFPSPVRVPLSRTGRFWIHIPCYSRFVGWATAGTITGAPVVTVDLIAKP